MSRGKENLWSYQCLLKVTTETFRTFSFTVSLAFAIYARLQKLKSFWLFFLCFLARVCPAFCLGQGEICWQLFGLCDLFGNGCEEHLPMNTSLLGPQEAGRPKKPSKALPFTVIFKYYWGGEVAARQPLPPWQGGPWPCVAWILYVGEILAPLSV